MNPEDDDSLDYNEDDYYGDDTLDDSDVTVEQLAFVYGIDISDHIRDME